MFRAVSYEGVEMLYATATKGATTFDSEIKGQNVAWVVVQSGLLQVKVNDKLYSSARASRSTSRAPSATG